MRAIARRDPFDRDVQRQPYPNLNGIINIVDVLEARRAILYAK